MRTEALLSILRQAVAGGAALATADYAQQYASLCAEANKRLGSCADYLKRGMIGEALRVADAEPQLLDLCAELDFVGVENWARICQDRKWTLAERLDNRAISVVNEAFSSGIILEPLLKEYRRAVRAGSTRECIRLLRRLVETDKTNTNWAEDLRGFERKRWGELRAEFEAACKAEDADALSGLLLEINGTWSLPREETLRDAVRDAAVLFYEKRALREARNIVQDLARAYSALGFESTGDALARYDRLLAAGYLRPDESMQVQVAEAREWHVAESKRRDDDRLYDESIARLRDAVEQGRPRDLEEILNVLTRFNRPIPDRLEDRAKSLLEGHKLVHARMRRRLMLTTVAVAVCFLAGIVKYLAHLRYERDLAAAVADLGAHFEAQDIAGFEAVLRRLEVDAPRVFRSADVQGWSARTGSLRDIVEQKRSAFESAFTRLAEIRNGGFREPAQAVEDLLSTAQTNALPGDLQGRLAVILREWEARKSALQAETDAAALKALESMDADAGELERLALDAAMADSLAKVARLEALATEAAAVHREASEPVKARFSALSSRLQAIETRVRSRQGQLTAIRNAHTLPEYVDALETYVRAFASDQRTEALQSVLDRRGAYLHLLEAPWASGPGNPFWTADAAARRARTERLRARWPAVKEVLLGLDHERRYCDMWECETANGLLYFEGRPRGVFIAGIRYYEGSFYVPKAADTQPEFVTDRVQASMLLRVTAMPHSDFMKSVVSIARFTNADESSRALAGRMDLLWATNGISALLKLRLMDLLAEQLETLVGDDAYPEWREFRTDLKSVDKSLHWLCTAHRDAKPADEMARGVLQKWFSDNRMLGGVQLLEDADDLLRKRDVRWVGSVDVQDAQHAIWRSGSRPDEVWVVRATNGAAHVLLAEERFGQSFKKYIKYSPGEPLFSPADGKTTREVLRTLKQRYDIPDTSGLIWPPAWPANLRN
jgi:hypothetical protein